jgi:hypothetical protein
MDDHEHGCGFQTYPVAYCSSRNHLCTYVGVLDVLEEGHHSQRGVGHEASRLEGEHKRAPMTSNISSRGNIVGVEEGLFWSKDTSTELLG